MKRLFFSAFAFLMMGGMAMAQSNQSQGPARSNTSVTADQLNNLFQKIEGRLTDFDSRLSNLESKGVGSSSGSSSSGSTGTSDDLYGGHECVDLGIKSNGKTLLFAKCNLGADHEYDYGNYYSWGETEGTPEKTEFTWKTYTYGYDSGVDEPKVTKYCNDANYGANDYTDALTELAKLNDAASVNWGGAWRMPTKEELQSLLDECNWNWVDAAADNGFGGVGGFKVSNPLNDDAFIFIPMAGAYNSSGYSMSGQAIGIWTSSLDLAKNGPAHAYGMQLIHADMGGTIYEDKSTGSINRCYGFCIRPVCYKQKHQY